MFSPCDGHKQIHETLDMIYPRGSCTNLMYIYAVILGRRLEDMPKDWATNYLMIQHEWVHLLDSSSAPPIDIFPFLKWVPSTFASWKRRAKIARTGLYDAYSALVDHAPRPGNNDANPPRFESLVERILRENQSTSDKKEPVLSKRGVIFIAGGVLDGAFDTTYHTALTLLKTFAAYPAIQKRVQNEIDAAWYVKSPKSYEILSSQTPCLSGPERTVGNSF